MLVPVVNVIMLILILASVVVEGQYLQHGLLEEK